MIVPLHIPQLTKFSDDELVAFCMANPELTVERDESGQLFISISPTYALTSSNNSELIAELVLWNRRKGNGKVLESSGGFFLPDTSMRVPDVAWVRNEQWERLTPAEKKSFPKLTPDFVIELKSDTDSLAELQKKMEKWIGNGVRMGWLIIPENAETHIYLPGSPVMIQPFEALLEGGGVLPGFGVRLSEILEY
ncbi:MAG: hypothetical protein ABS46_14975 [Cytophagaceae bacterium SCN 52-12]|nr:MAG: hypothetical protein ABS46_14975 [Cytophagaceae bacterium SCN 52-12]